MPIRGLAFPLGGFMRSLGQSRLGTLLLVTLLTAGGLAGCRSGPPRGEVRGKVTFHRKPVKEGSITFIDPNGKESGDSELGPDGSYELPHGLPVGEYIVTITPLMHLVDSMPGKTPPALEEKPAPDIPKKYRNQNTTPFRATVKEGQNEPFIFDMTR